MGGRKAGSQAVKQPEKKNLFQKQPPPQKEKTPCYFLLFAMPCLFCNNMAGTYNQ